MNDKIQISDIVRFTSDAVCRAAIFCQTHGITGKVVGEEHDVYAIDVGFHYLVYVKPHQLAKVISQKDVPEITEVE